MGLEGPEGVAGKQGTLTSQPSSLKQKKATLEPELA